jgi:23S rRNA (guanosine2251-2'-O)-methyltransferase
MEILYGVHPVAECIRAGRRRVLTLEVSEKGRVEALEKALGCRLPLKPGFISRDALTGKAGNANHQGVVAKVEPYPYVDWRDLLEGPGRFLLLLDNLEDPQNVGAILRTAYCAGVTGVTLRKHHAAQVTPAVAKASAGACEHLPIALVPNQSMVLDACEEGGFTRVALGMEGESLWDATHDWKGNLAAVVGSEGRGISPLVARHCDRTLAIPMRGTLDSLNASVAAALLLFEVARRRNAG